MIDLAAELLAALRSADGKAALARRYRRDPARGVDREAWPPAPFAPVHIASTETPQGAHAVVMLADGTVLDPWDCSRTTLRHPDYRAVHNVVGVWRVAEERAA